mmetsp:Transcript_27337/g.61463  ORF Transcript_27337/g.61463 Transcript_27337/m.61463 type:complete len:109 (+) Transcript_27337:3-329(+)
MFSREWRVKWSAEDNKKSLTEAQKVLDNIVVPELKKVHGLCSVTRTVCGECQDFKILCKLPLDAFEDWAASSFEPEAQVMEAFMNIPGCSKAEAQTFYAIPVFGRGHV